MSYVVTAGDRILAREVIDMAAANYRNGMGPADRLDFEAVIRDRWDARGTGGVAMANRRTIRGVEAAIREFYEPDDHSPEPEVTG